MTVLAFSSVLSPLTHSSSIPPFLISLHEPQFSCSLSLSLPLSLFSHSLPSHHFSHTPESFPLLPLTSHWRSTAAYSFFLSFFSSFWLLVLVLCSHIQQHHADVLAVLYVAPWTKKQAADCRCSRPNTLKRSSFPEQHFFKA